MMPSKKTIFLPLSEIEKYSDSQKFYCTSVVFSPETENNHFAGCPPYISISSVDDTVEDIFFEVPEIVAYYAKTHPAYTIAGMERRRQQGERDMVDKIKHLLNLD